jgi:hypothetical protein
MLRDADAELASGRAAVAVEGEGRAARRVVPIPTGKARRLRVSPFWMKQLHAWHWMSSAVCLVTMLLFSVTGFTLNHAGEIEGSASVATREETLPPRALEVLRGAPGSGDAPIPAEVSGWAAEALGVDLGAGRAEWSAEELYVSLPRPGGDGWLSIDRATGAVTYEATDRGWIAWMNDLHKGRNTGTAWRWFIDVFAVACVIFSLTGFVLLQIHAYHRRSTWPLVGAGLALPVLVIVLFVH